MKEKEIEWKPNIKISMVIRKGQNYEPSEELKKKFKQWVK